MKRYDAALMTPEEEAYDELRCYTLGLRDPAFIHQHVVDAFTAQHADARTKPIALTFALVGLYLAVERQYSGSRVQQVHSALARARQTWPAFSLPVERGSTTVADVLRAPPGAPRDAAILAWCACVWQAFRASHQAVAELLHQRGVS